MSRQPSARAVMAATLGIAGSSVSSLPAQRVLYQSPAFVVTDSSVRQGRFEAVAISRDTILSSYPRAAREVHFKFSINSLENEFRPGTDHTINVRPHDGRVSTPVYVFGVEQPPHIPPPDESAGGEDGMAQVTFRVDMRGVLRSFREQGYYDPPNGPRIRRDEFQAVYVIGDADPMTWDFRSLRPGAQQQMTDPDSDGVYSVTLPIAPSYTRPLGPGGRAIWARSADLSGFPQLSSPQRLQDALYRMSLEELRQLVRPDGALSAGAKWPGVWTRDISLSSVLALALVVPDAVRTSLMAKVDPDGRIIQDTGTGGSWPISTDRTTWAMAAWELYATTGDRDWLRRSYDIIRRSVEADRHAAFDPTTGLFRGESSFLDWREQSYPRWMEPRDIYQGEALGTNAVHYATYRVLGDMARALGEPAQRWGAMADSVRGGMNAQLWQPGRGWYGQYRYGHNYLELSPRAEGLGEALAIIYGVASPTQRARLTERLPLVAFGTPTIWPYIPNEPLYHNGTIWPFVTAYWTWASAEAGNTAAVEHGLAANSRAAALFLTNKENMVAATGHFEGTALNSDRQLWSVAGTLASTYRLLFGMRLRPDRLVFRPMVPPSYRGERTLSGVRYRGAILTVTVRGFGDRMARSRLDGRAVARAEVPAELVGAHTLELDLNGRWPDSRINVVESRYSLAAPRVQLRGDTLAWMPVPGAAHYVVRRNGRRDTVTLATYRTVAHEPALSEYQVLAVDSAGVESFLSEPVRVVADAAVTITEPPAAQLEHEHAGSTGAGYVTLTRERNTTIEIPVSVARSGLYAVDARYANGSGPINTDSKAAVRTVAVDGRTLGVVVMPQRGQDRWTDWGYSNALRVKLSPGRHVVTLTYSPLDENMSRTVNTALLDHVRLTLLADGAASRHHRRHG